MKYPIGIQSFEQIREDGYVYVDKTALIYDLVHKGKIYILCRPRRFGKSLLVSTLKCYFEGRRDLFEGLAMEALEKEWKQYPVFHLSFGGQDFTQPTTLDRVLDDFVKEGEALYGKGEFAQTIGSRFKAVIANARRKSGHRAVVLIDEYDKPLLDVMDLDTQFETGYGKLRLEDYNRNLLKGFYSVFKEADADLQFVLLTGVTKFSQVSVFSGFNQPNDISMDEECEALCGITEEELHRVFDAPIQAMAQRYKVASEEMKRRLKRKYDGYHFSPNMLDIYNPFSILNALSKRMLSDFWFATGTPTYLIRLLSHSRENMNELTGRYYPREDFVDYRANVEAPLPMIYQSGYLTIKDWDMEVDAYLLDFPNDEVKRGFVAMLTTSYLQLTESPASWGLQVVEAMKRGDCSQLEKLLTSFFASIPYTQRRKDDERERERYFQYTFYLILRMISCFTVYIEKEQSEGRVDCVVETLKHVYILEFKRDGVAEEALQQIERKGYAREYAADERGIHLIGCNFSSKTGTIDGWICKD